VVIVLPFYKCGETDENKRLDRPVVYAEVGSIMQPGCLVNKGWLYPSFCGADSALREFYAY
jgi:hypothetical protein